MRRCELHNGWTVAAVGGPIPEGFPSDPLRARVPGVVHTDLLAAGLIPDPFVDDAEQTLAWIGRSDWRYRLDFDWDDDGSDRHDLVCDGLDTIAAVRLNGRPLGTTRNQHRAHRFDVRSRLRSGTNRLEIDFASALNHAEAVRDSLGRRPQVYPHPYAMIRKSACNFGWDWGPELVTAGIWRPIAIESWSGARIAAVRASARADGTARFAVELERMNGDPLAVRARVGGVVAEVATATESVELELRVSEPRLWWPHTHGSPERYPAVVEIDGDTWNGQIGFRTIRVESEPDADGIPFRVIVNGHRVFVRGANWIPDDVFPSRVVGDRYRRRLGDAVDANVNLLRVWGGGIYESEAFYDECDRVGLLVWQDFLFACAAYPEEEPLWGEVAAEARGAISRIASHPSLALWNGGNETIWGHTDWGWAPELGARTWGERYYGELLPALVAELDLERTYIENSPFSWDPSHHPNDPADGLVHIWDVWNERDYTAYATYRPRFVSEFGFQGPPAWSTLVSAVHDGPLAPDGPQLLLHQKADDGQAKIARGLAPHLPAPHDMVDWHWSAQLNQARAVRFALEWFRSLDPVCDGAIVWQLNDCWPAISWAAVDGAGIRKPMWFAMRSAFADRILVLTDGELVVVNDAGEPFTAAVRLSRFTFDGTCLADDTVRVTVAARQTARLALAAPFRPDRAAAGFVAARAAGVEGTVRLDREPIDAPPAVGTVRSGVERTRRGYRVRVRADRPTFDLCLLPDRLDRAATVDRGMVTLLPGETAVLDVRSDVDIDDPGALGKMPVLRSLNDLFGPSPECSGTTHRP